MAGPNDTPAGVTIWNWQIFKFISAVDKQTIMKSPWAWWVWTVYLLRNFTFIKVWPAGIWSPPTWGWDFGYHCRRFTLCPVPSITAILETTTLRDLLIALLYVILLLCQDCQCGPQSLPQAQEAVATSSTVTSGWPALPPDYWSSDTFFWDLQWEEVTLLKRFVFRVSKSGI